MTTTKYKIVNCTELNIRKSPSINAKIDCTVKAGKTLEVVNGWSKKVTEKGKTRIWYKIKSGSNFLYVSSAYLKKIETVTTIKKVNYGTRVVSAMKSLVNEVCKKKLKHISGAYWYNGEKVNCAVTVAYALYKAGCNPDKVLLNHSSSGLSNTSKIKHYTWVKVNKKFKDLDKKYKVNGCVYGYESNVAIYIDGNIWSFNYTDTKYDEVSDVCHCTGYNFDNKIIVVGVPKTE